MPASSVVLIDSLPRDPDTKPSETLNQYNMFIAISDLQLTSLRSSWTRSHFQRAICSAAKNHSGEGGGELFTPDLHGQAKEIYLPLSGFCHFLRGHILSISDPIMACCLLMASAVASSSGKSHGIKCVCPLVCIYMLCVASGQHNRKQGTLGPSALCHGSHVKPVTTQHYWFTLSHPLVCVRRVQAVCAYAYSQCVHSHFVDSKLICTSTSASVFTWLCVFKSLEVKFR